MKRDFVLTRKMIKRDGEPQCRRYSETAKADVMLKERKKDNVLVDDSDI